MGKDKKEHSTMRTRGGTRRLFRPFAAASAVLIIGTGLAACSKSNTPAATTTAPTTSAVPTNITPTSFTNDFSEMKQLTGLAAQGKGLVGVLLPDTTTSARYVEFDAPYLTQAFEAAGLSTSDFKVDNAHGSASTMQTQAEADITAGASVLLIDALDSGSGAAIEANAEAHGVKVIDYDRLTLGGPADRYYVSFNNVQVGQLIGKGEVSCLAAWKVKKPNILIMDGDPTDNNAKLFAQGYNGVLKPYFDKGTYVKVGEPAGTWDAPTAATTFEQQFTAHPNINAVVTPNDNVASAVVAQLQKQAIPPNTFPTTGQDASDVGLQNILLGYQCGTVYKPVFLEAQAAATIALFLRAGQTPPSTLVNATTTDSEKNVQVASVYTVPVWVTADNMESTVMTDTKVTGQGTPASDLCTTKVASACAKAGIS